jgi:hypothetical protein
MTEADLAKLGRDELVALILKQAASLEQQVTLIAALQAKVEELSRSGKRQAAPFSKGARVKAPQAARSQAGPGAVQDARGARARATLRAPHRRPHR